MSSNQKVYDYDRDKVRDKLVDIFRKRKGEATTADLVAMTGLPKHQVDSEVKAVSDEYGARLRVTDSGEILYSFPSGMRSHYRGFGPSFLRGWKSFRKAAAKVAAFLFKIWIVVMLVGYFVLFVALAVLAMLASVTVSMSGNSRDSRSSSRGGGGGLFFAGRLLDLMFRIWFYSELFTPPEQRAARRDKRRSRKPLYKAIYSFVFGDGDPDAAWDETEKKAFVAFAQANKGVVTMPEFMAITGLPPLEAEGRINRYMYEFEGSPEVTEGGAIYYFFPELLRRKDRADRSFGGSVPMRRIAQFSANPKKANATFCAFNAVNLLFGSYFLYGSLTVPAMHILTSHLGIRGFDYLYIFTTFLAARYGNIADPSALLGVVLGVVPLAFSVLFYLVPAVRAKRLADRNEAAREENLRRVAYRTVLDSPIPVRPESIPVRDDAARPKDSRAAEKTLKQLAAWSGGEPAADGSYSYPEIERGKAEAAKARASVDLSAYDLGGVAFDSDAPAR
jgi:hypothetical protein